MDTANIPDSLKLYTLQEAAEILKVNVRSIHRYKKDGRLEARRIGGQWRVTQDAIERFIHGDNGAAGGNAG